MLKVGSKVRCIQNEHHPNLKLGQIYTVSAHSIYGFNVLKEVPDCPIGFFDCRFELVINEPTDQELADDYRHVRAKLHTIREQLMSRGYEVESRGEKTFITRINNI